MEGKHRPQKVGFAFISFLLIASCSIEASRNDGVVSITNFQHGDIICRLGKGFTSNYFRKFGSEEGRFSHIGIIVVDSVGKPDVIHAEASEWSGKGFVRKQTLDAFLEESQDVSLYRVSGSIEMRQKVGAVALNYFRNKTPFDLNFDLNNDVEVYCTELVALCINRAADSVIITPMRNINNKRYFGLDDIYTHPMLSKIDQ